MKLDAVDVREGRVLRLLWELGLCEYDRLTSWADALIARLRHPPYELTEISMAHVLEPGVNPFGTLLGGDYSAREIIAALAQANSDAIALKPLCDALGTVANMAIRLELNPDTQTDPALVLLHQAFGAHEGYYFFESGTTSEAAVRRDVSEYFRRVREAAAHLEVST